MEAQNIVFERDNDQIIQEGRLFFTRSFINGESFESANYNTLERAKKSLHILPTIEENNVMIALFMGGNLDPDTDNFWLENLELPENKNRSHIEQCKYNSSWDWLMPVVEKIESLLPDDSVIMIEYKDCYIPVLDDGEPFTIQGRGGTKLIAVYEACLEFIKWHNEQNN
ncbi:MAG: hypothetical protein V4666_08040 [Bacteroidota bacterium]